VPNRRRTHFAARDLRLPTAEISCRNPLNGHSYLAEFSGVNTRSLPVTPDNRVLGTQKRRGAAGKKTEDSHICLHSAHLIFKYIVYFIYLVGCAANLQSRVKHVFTEPIAELLPVPQLASGPVCRESP
jgi:hypothetical protein